MTINKSNMIHMFFTVVFILLIAAAALASCNNEPNHDNNDKNETETVIYDFKRCVYINPISSYAPFESNDYYYLIGENSFGISVCETDKVIEYINNIHWNWFNITPAELNRMFEIDIGIPDFNLFESIKICELSELYSMLDVDGELWLITFSRSNTDESHKSMVWSIYEICRR